MPPDACASLLAALLALQPDPARPRARVVIAPLPAPPPLAHGRANGANGAGTAPGSAALAPLRAVARVLLRSARARRLALGLLARVPVLHAKALAVLFAPDKLIALDPIPLAPALAHGLSPRARLAARRRQLAQQGRTADSVATGTIGTIGKPRDAARPRLAFISPLPPARTGIADYAAQLLGALADDFDITLVAQQDSVVLPPELASLPLRDVAWLRAQAHTFDHLLYQVGNSEFHSHMFALLRDYPGVVVLHDFFLGNVMGYRQMRRDPPGAWTGALFHAHGYPALLAWRAARARTDLFKTYPCNLAVLEQASAVIVHSSHAAELARAWYGPTATRNWHSAPLPRAAPPVHDRAAARAALGIGADVFLVCSFGHIVPNKLADRLLAAWCASALHQDQRCLLVLVGANQDSPFGATVARLAAAAPGSVAIAGWCDDAVYHQYLQAADLGVQLRTRAQGETSAAVLDCMNYGLATIINANGSMAALPADAVLRLPDDFDDAALTAALEALYRDDARRTALGRRAARLLEDGYRPVHSAARYLDALRAASTAASAPLSAPLPVRQLLVDIGDGDIAARDQRGELLALLAAGGVRVELVRLVQEHGRWQWRYARQAAAALLDLAWAEPDDALVDLAPGDILYCPAPSEAALAAGRAGLWQDLRAHGVLLAFGWPVVAAAPDARAHADLVVCRDDASAAAYNSGS